jgi:hypothetical protein
MVRPLSLLLRRRTTHRTWWEPLGRNWSIRRPLLLLHLLLSLLQFLQQLLGRLDRWLARRLRWLLFRLPLVGLLVAGLAGILRHIRGGIIVTRTVAIVRGLGRGHRAA